MTLTHARTRASRRIAIRPRVSTDSLYALRSAAVLGLGVAVGSAWLLIDDVREGRLLHLTPDWHAAPLPVYLTYPHARYHPSRMLRFIATMRDAIPAAMAP